MMRAKKETKMVQGKPLKPISVADLPGYGFANVDDALKKSWVELLRAYCAI